MIAAGTLLPPSSTPIELALERTSAARHPLPAHLVSDTWNPATCPTHLLGFLAWSLSLDLWDEAWTETKKREACRRALELHRLKTTPAGIKEHVKLVGAEVLQVIRPPARGSLRGVMNEADRLAWLDDLPQVRIYPFAKKTTRPRRLFYTGPGVSRQFRGRKAPLVADAPFWGKGFVRRSRGFSTYGRRATYFDRGVEVEAELGTIDGGLVDRVLIRRQAQRRVFHGRGFEGGHLRATSAEQSVLTLRLSDTAETFAVESSLKPVDVRAQRIAQQRTAPAPRAFFGRHGGFLKTSHAPLLIYDRIALNAPDRLGARRKVRSFHGRGRFGIDAFSAELKIRVPMQRTRRRSGRWHGAGFRQAADLTPLQRAIEAVRVSKALRDTVRINTATFGRVKFTSGLRFGEFAFGQMREV